MENVNLCKELEEVREHISKTVDDAIKRLYEVRNRLAKVIAVDMGLIRGETDKYEALVAYMDLLSLIAALTSGEITISIDIDRVLENLGCKAK
jgi:chorismate mutase